MGDRQVAIMPPSDIATADTRDQSLTVPAGVLHQQRLFAREQHHHKQLWSKDAHGGAYRKVRYLQLLPGFSRENLACLEGA